MKSNLENNIEYERFLDRAMAPIHAVSETYKNRSSSIILEIPKQEYDTIEESIQHAYDTTFSLLLRMHEEENIDGYHMRYLQDVFEYEHALLARKFLATADLRKLAKERLEAVTNTMNLVLRDRSSKSMEFYRNTMEQLENFEKSYPDRPLTRKEKKRLERLFLQDRRTANARRKDMENNKWQFQDENDALIQEEAHEAESDNQAIRLTQIVQERVITSARMISLLDAFDQRYQSERSLVLERLEMHEMHPDHIQL